MLYYNLRYIEPTLEELGFLMNPEATAQERSELVDRALEALYERGHSYREIMAAVPISMTCLKEHFKENGINIRPLGGPNRFKKFNPPQPQQGDT